MVPERLDTESMPLTEPHWPPIFDTGPNPKPLSNTTTELEPEPEPVVPQRDPDNNPWRFSSSSTTSSPIAFTPPESISWSDETVVLTDPHQIAAQPVSVPSQLQFLRRWKLALVLLGVWIVAAAAGAGFYYWWYQSLDKTWPDFAVLVYVLVCTVASLVVSMVPDRPMVSGTSIAVMSAPFASGLAAAAMYGMFAFGWVTP